MWVEGEPGDGLEDIKLPESMFGLSALAAPNGIG